MTDYLAHAIVLVLFAPALLAAIPAARFARSIAPHRFAPIVRRAAQSEARLAQPA